MEGFYKRKEASKLLRIHHHTLTKLASINEIETTHASHELLRAKASLLPETVQKLYNVNKFLIDNGVSKNLLNNNLKKNICYCRVSSNK